MVIHKCLYFSAAMNILYNLAFRKLICLSCCIENISINIVRHEYNKLNQLFYASFFLRILV